MAEGAIAYFENDKPRMREVLPRLEKHVGEPFVSATFISNLCFRLGETDRGFEWLERSYSARELGVLSIRYDESLDSVRADPRYVSLMKRLGLDQA
jgi:hypothetical protein